MINATPKASHGTSTNRSLPDTAVILLTADLSTGRPLLAGTGPSFHALRMRTRCSSRGDGMERFWLWLLAPGSPGPQSAHRFDDAADQERGAEREQEARPRSALKRSAAEAAEEVGVA